MKLGIPNILSIVRILLIPPVLYCIVRWRSGEETFRFIAAGLFFLASSLDAIDGWLARKLNQITDLGRILDPLADRFLMVLSIIFLTYWNFNTTLILIVTAYTVVNIARDLIVGAGYALIKLVGKSPLSVKPSILGKVSCALQFILILLVFIQVPHNILNPFLLLSGIFVVCSGLQYALDGYAQYKSHS